MYPLAQEIGCPATALCFLPSVLEADIYDDSVSLTVYLNRRSLCYPVPINSILPNETRVHK